MVWWMGTWLDRGAIQIEVSVDDGMDRGSDDNQVRCGLGPT